jgi:hypothetical protein
MQTNKLLVVAVLAIAIGAPIAGFVGDSKMPQPTTSPGVGLPFLHGYPTVRPGVDPNWLLSSVRTSGSIRLR